MKPEEKARISIDRHLRDAGWEVLDREQLGTAASSAVAVREFPTKTGPADYLLVLDGKAVGIVEAKESTKGGGITAVEQQTERYMTSPLIGFSGVDKRRFAYEATDEIIRFTDYADRKKRSRQVFCFHRPETMRALLAKGKATLRNNLKNFPILNDKGFRDCQKKAIKGLEASMAMAKPRTLIQMATGAGKTFTAITATYRMLKYGKMNRVLFLVDTRSLGEQAEREFQAYKPNDDPRPFSSIYGVTRLKSPTIPKDTAVYISTIQRMYSLLKGEPMDEREEEKSCGKQADKPREVVYNPAIPPEFFDCIIVDECHRSIYNIWSQVLEYFDAFTIGLTATPDKRTLGYFHENLVSEYTRAEAIADGVNVGEDIFLIETNISLHGATVLKHKDVEFRDRLTRKRSWEKLDDDLTYAPSRLNGDVVNPSQIRTIIRTFREHITTTLFPDRQEVPKTLIFAKDDTHADDIVQILREEFGEENDFCQKITYRCDDPERTLSAFRNSYYPRIAVTVDMIATGTDVKAIECLVFMRDVRSKSYYEQMVGRGTRTLDKESLRAVSPSAKADKDHFVIVDAVGVTTSPKTESCQFETKPTVSLRELMESIAAGKTDEATFTATANRLLRLATRMTRSEHAEFEKKVGPSLRKIAKDLLYAYDTEEIDRDIEPVLAAADHSSIEEAGPRIKEAYDTARNIRITLAAIPFHSPQIRELILEFQRRHRQLLDTENTDSTVFAGWDADKDGKAEEMLQSFRAFIEEHRDELTALGIIYDQPFKLRTDTLQQLKELQEQLRARGLTPQKLGHCYDLRDKKQRGTLAQVTDLVTLIRYELGLNTELSPFADRVRANYKSWIFRRNAGKGQFTEEQNKWLQHIRDHIISSLNITKDDFEYTPFGDIGGLARFYELFGAEYETLLEEMNIELVG